MKYIFRLLLIQLILWCSVLGGYGQSASDIQAYIAKYKQIALEQEREYGIPASITLAQGILESGAGKSGLAMNANNHFGIKSYGGWTGKTYAAWDDEASKSHFRWYGSAAESYKDHSRFLVNNERYSFLFSKSVYDYRGWANGLQRAGYATSPTYAKALIGYIDTYRLYVLNGGVKLRPGKKEVITRTITIEELVEQNFELEENEETEEQVDVQKTIKKFLVEINDVRCTILYPGETLSSISMKYDIHKSQLLEYNETTNEKDFKEGDIVFLGKKKKKYTGPKDDYRVKEGDTLYKISQQFGIRLSSLSKMNDKDLFTSLRVGEVLRLK